MNNIYAIVGAGGHGREVIPLVEQMFASNSESAKCKIVFVVEGTDGTVLNGYDVISPEAFFRYPADNYFFNVAIADSYVRKRIAEEFMAKGAKPFTVTHSSAVLFDTTNIGEGGIFSPFTCVTVNARIGKFFHANLYSYVTHDCVIGDYVTFGPGVQCNGNVVIEDHAYLGAGAIIKQGTPKNPVVIGAGAIIGMGSIVTKSVSAGVTVVGNPAKPLSSGGVR